MTKDCSRGITRSKWFLPAFSLVLGLVMLAVSWLGGCLGQGLISLAVLAGFGLIVLLAGRSETVRRDRAATRPGPEIPAGWPPGNVGPAGGYCGPVCGTESARPSAGAIGPPAPP